MRRRAKAVLYFGGHRGREDKGRGGAEVARLARTIVVSIGGGTRERAGRGEDRLARKSVS